MTDNVQINTPSISNRVIHCAIFLLLLLTVLPYTTVFPNTPAYFLGLLAYIVFVVYAVSKQSKLVAPKYAIASLSIIWIIYLIHLTGVTALSRELVMRVPIFVVITAVNVFYLPYIINPKYFLSAVSRLSAIVVIIGLPTAFLGAYSLLGLEITAWQPNQPAISFDGIDLYTLKSIFQNPNPFGVLTFAGTITALYEFDRRSSMALMGILLINGLGVLLSRSRSAILAASIGTVLYVMYNKFSRHKFLVLSVMMGLVGTFSFLMMLGVMPSIIPFEIDFTGRLELWEAGIEATINNPWIGLGPGERGELIRPFLDGPHTGANTHNSYLRVFVTAGLIGGVMYLYLFGRTALSHFLSIENKESAVMFALLAAFMVSQVFEAYSVFGLSSNSVLVSLTLGYSLMLITSFSNHGQNDTHE